MPVSTVQSLADGVLAGNRRALARAISVVEAGKPGAHEIIRMLYPHAGHAHVLGITGSPGTGKSSLVSALARHYRADGATVGIVAVDPTSPFSGGAILGDRIRMRELAGDPGVFIRSMATRGHLGGLAVTTSDVVRVLDAAGFDVVVVETVGVGQAEVDIARLAHSVIVVEAPGLGDDVQTLKAGVMEIADIFVVNKTDLPGADAVVNMLRAAVSLSDRRGSYTGHHGPESFMEPQPESSEERTEHSWRVPVVEVTVLRQEGIAELVEVIKRHREYLYESGVWRQREKKRIESDLKSHLQTLLLKRFLARIPTEEWERCLEDMLSRDVDPYTAGLQMLEQCESPFD